MDANKLEALKALPYKIKKCCGNCKHAFFGNTDWTTCNAHEYEHLKHTDTKRKLSVNAFGYCPKHEWDENYVQIELPTWEDFMEP